MTGDTDTDGEPTPDEARRLLPELTAAMLTGERLGRVLARVAAADRRHDACALTSLGARWMTVANDACPPGRDDDRRWNTAMLAAGIRECMAVLSVADAA